MLLHGTVERRRSHKDLSPHSETQKKQKQQQRGPEKGSSKSNGSSSLYFRDSVFFLPPRHSSSSSFLFGSLVGATCRGKGGSSLAGPARTASSSCECVHYCAQKKKRRVRPASRTAATLKKRPIRVVGDRAIIVGQDDRLCSFVQLRK